MVEAIAGSQIQTNKISINQSINQSISLNKDTSPAK